MDNQTVPYDPQAVRTLIALWTRRVSATEPDLEDDFADLAAIAAVRDGFKAAEAAGASFEMGLCTGVEFGIALTLATLNAPLTAGACEGIEDAIDAAKVEIAHITATALEDRAREAA